MISALANNSALDKSGLHNDKFRTSYLCNAMPQPSAQPVHSVLRDRGCNQLAVVAALFSLTSVMEAAPAGLAELVRGAELIAAVKVLSTDETAMPADGPMYVEARLLKSVKGSLPVGQRIRFGASAWVGPSYRSGEERIVFLSPVPRGDAYYAKASWSSLDAGKINVFFVKETLDDFSKVSLLEFLGKIEAQPPLRLESKLAPNTGAGHRLLLSLVNDGSQTLWLNPDQIVTSVEANQVMYAPPVTWGRAKEWVSLRAAEALPGNASLEQLAGVEEMTITIRHRSVRFPNASWVGSSRITVKLRE